MNTMINSTLVAGIPVVTASNSAITTSTMKIFPHSNNDAVLDKYELNELTVEHKVQEFELMKLRETDVNYAEVIKENLAKLASREVIKKATFTKKKDLDTETTSFRARVWVFTKDELNQLIEDIKNGI